jgi:hypothetical protein
MKVINEPHTDPEHGLRIREFAEFFGADELDFESGYDAIVLRKGDRQYRISANSNQSYEFLTVERVL